MTGSTFARYDQSARGSAVQGNAVAARQYSAPGRGAGVTAGGDHGHAIAVIRRLAVCLDEEIAALGSSPLVDLTAFGARKGQGLMELNRVLSAVGALVPGSAIALECAMLHKAIIRNMRVLELHVAAVKEITGVITDAIRSEESDGTYSPSIQGKRGAR